MGDNLQLNNSIIIVRFRLREFPDNMLGVGAVAFGRRDLRDLGFDDQIELGAGVSLCSSCC